MAWASRMVVPKSVHASISRPEFVRQVSIMIRVWIRSKDGLCIKDLSRTACTAAATEDIVRNIELQSYQTYCTRCPFVTPHPQSQLYMLRLTVPT
jgi:hypothetical protein